jgi:hypothetical protein
LKSDRYDDGGLTELRRYGIELAARLVIWVQKERRRLSEAG